MKKLTEQIQRAKWKKVEIEEIPQQPAEVIPTKVRSVFKERNRKGAPPAKRPRECSPVMSSGMDALGLSQLGVNTPPGLTVTPLGINGTAQPGTATNQQQPSSVLGPPPPYPTGSATSTPGRAKIATVSRIGGRPRIISWMDAPDDVYFYANDTTKKLRKSITTTDLKRAARRPWKNISDAESGVPSE